LRVSHERVAHARAREVPAQPLTSPGRR